MPMDPVHTRMIRQAQAVDFAAAQRVAPGIIAAALRYDSRIRIYWDRSISRFCIAREGEMQWHFIAVWQDENGGFLPLDRRILEALALWDLRPPRLDAPKNADEKVDRMEAEEQAREDKIRRDFEGDIDHITRADRRQIEKSLKSTLNVH